MRIPPPTISSLALTALALLALAGAAPRAGQLSAAPDYLAGFEDIHDHELGQVLEGDGPAPDRFPPGALPDAPHILADDPIDAPAEGGPVDFRHYADPEEIQAFLTELEARYPDLVQVDSIGRSWQDRPILAVRLTNERSAQPIADRPAIYIDGQHHARELVSAAAALYNAWHLVDGYGRDPVATRVLDSRVVFIVPSVNVDGNALVLADNQDYRKTLNPTCCDDDGDGKVDEDPTVGYGYGTDTVYRYQFEQAWADAHPTDPFAEGYEAHQAAEPMLLGTFTGALGGPRQPVARVDDDGDGRREEDPRGGVDPNRNYDWFWDEGDTRVRSESFRGPERWSEPEVRAARDFVSELGTLAASISYHSGTDLLLHPWAYSETASLPDAGYFELLGAKGSQLTEVHGFPGTVRTWTARGLYSAAGSSMDYLYGRLGAMAFAPETYGGGGISRVERVGATGAFTVGTALGFNFNPRPEHILPTVDRWDRWARYLMAASPNVELNALRRQGDRLVIRLGSEGVMPLRVKAGLEWADGRRLELRGESDGVVHAQVLDLPVALGELRPTGNRLVVEAILATGMAPHVVERAQWAFDLDGDGRPVLTEGAMSAYQDLSVHFGGWWAGPEWDAPRYRCPGGECPPRIEATPPTMPRPGAELSLPWLQMP